MSLTSYHTFHSDLPELNVPEDYNRLHSSLDPTQFPSPRIVGLLACQRDPYRRQLDKVEIIKTGKHEQPKLKGRNIKKGAATTDSSLVWEVELSDTVLFPEGQSCLVSSLHLSSYLDALAGGGQPNDTGSLTLSSDHSTSFKVINVTRRGLTAVHLVSIPTEMQDKVDDLLKLGTLVNLAVDWERRLDHVSGCTLVKGMPRLTSFADDTPYRPTSRLGPRRHPPQSPNLVMGSSTPPIPRASLRRALPRIESTRNQRDSNLVQ